jgi:hypothetical protein
MIAHMLGYVVEFVPGRPLQVFEIANVCSVLSRRLD